MAATTTIAQPYQVALVNNDLTNDETLLDVFHSLDHLSAIVNEIFNKIDNRIDAEKNRINYIKARVNVCQQKVQQIKGSSQAITIFSTAKYPAPKQLPLYPTLLQESSITHPIYRDLGDDAIYLPAEESSSLINHRDLQTEVVAIYTRVNAHGRDLERVEFVMEDEGLGAVPVHVSSISSVLLFNSSVNVYKNYQTLDNLEFTGREKTMKDEASKALASAPATLVSGDALPDIQGLDLTFKPTMGEMSSLALPENLPLDFLANNVQFTGVDLPSIAPSSYGKANYSLPQITDGGYSTGPTAKQSSATSSSASSSSGPPPPPPPTGGATAAASAPPPPPPPSSSTASSSGPPPPPPPMPPVESAAGPPLPPAAAPPMAAASSAGDESAGGGGGESSSLPKPDGRRASLLDSIKGMGVSKLKKRDENSPEEAERRPARKEPPKAMSMQDALRERLARRNDAISGKSDRDSKHRDSVIIREAAMKTPAPAPAASSSSSSAKKPSLASLGFATVDDTKKGGDSDEESTMLPKMSARPAAARPATKKSNQSDSDSDSDLSMESRAPAAAKAPVIAPPVPMKVAAPAVMPTKPAAQPAAAAKAKDEGNDQAMFASMLARASTVGKKKSGDDSDSDSDDDGGEEDWD